MNEAEFRELMGVGGPLEIEFAGRSWKLRDGTFAALLAYALSCANAGPEGGDEAALAALHKLLERCVADFGRFTDAAQTSKATLEEVTAAAKKVIEIYTARNFWAAMRLLGYVALHLGEIDGDLIRTTGKGMAGLTPREACNLALAICLDGREEEDRLIFLEDLNYEGNPESEALAALRAFQQQRKEAAEAAGG